MRYCGSKHWQRKQIDELLPGETDLLVSPFFGSGKVEYYLAARRPHMSVVGRDTFEEAVGIHRCAQTRHDEFERAVREEPLPDSTEAYSALFERMRASGDEFERSVLAYVILHCSYNGRFGSFRLEDVGPRRVPLRPLPNLSVEHGDGMEWIRSWPGRNAVIYADPPYLLPRRKHYASGRATHKPEFHRRLAESLQSCGTPFILSINDCPEIRRLYEERCLFEDPGRRDELLVLGPREFWALRRR